MINPESVLDHLQTGVQIAKCLPPVAKRLINEVLVINPLIEKGEKHLTEIKKMGEWPTDNQIAVIQSSDVRPLNIDSVANRKSPAKSLPLASIRVQDTINGLKRLKEANRKVIGALGQTTLEWIAAIPVVARNTFFGPEIPD